MTIAEAVARTRRMNSAVITDDIAFNDIAFNVIAFNKESLGSLYFYSGARLLRNLLCF